MSATGDLAVSPFKFVVSEEVMRQLIANGQIATQYVDLEGKMNILEEYI